HGLVLPVILCARLTSTLSTELGRPIYRLRTCTAADSRVACGDAERSRQGISRLYAGRAGPGLRPARLGAASRCNPGRDPQGLRGGPAEDAATHRALRAGRQANARRLRAAGCHEGAG